MAKSCPTKAKELSKMQARDLLKREDDKIRLVQFHSPLCEACEEVTPEMHAAAKKLCGDADVCRVNADTSEDLTEDFNVEDLPTVAVIKNGKILDKIEGSGEGSESDDFVKLVERYLK